MSTNDKLTPQPGAPPICPKCYGVGTIWLRSRWPNGTPGGTAEYPTEDCLCDAGQAAKLRRQTARYAAAHLPHSSPSKTFDNFQARRGTEQAFLIAQAYSENLQDVPILTLSGNPGCGKSHLLEAIGWRALERGLVVRYTVGASLLDELRASYDPDSPDRFQDVFDRYDRADLLLLDDPGVEAATPWAMEKLFTLVNNRCMNRRALAIATNLNQRTMRDHLGPRTADRIWDTGSGLTAVAVITAGSYRTGIER